MTKTVFEYIQDKVMSHYVVADSPGEALNLVKNVLVSVYGENPEDVEKYTFLEKPLKETEMIEFVSRKGNIILSVGEVLETHSSPFYLGGTGVEIKHKEKEC